MFRNPKFLISKYFFSPVAFVLSFLPYAVKIFLFEMSSGIPSLLGLSIRYIVFRSINNKIGYNFYIGRWVVIKHPRLMNVGENVSIHEYCYIDAYGGLSIDDNVSIAHACSIISFEHSWSDLHIPIKYNPIIGKSICIGSDVWVGAGVRILGGAVIHSRVILASGSVVKGELLPSRIYAGVPAKIIKVI
jgi:acetyltransferase-like isoleucine patch superfamily enzyme